MNLFASFLVVFVPFVLGGGELYPSFLLFVGMAALFALGGWGNISTRKSALRITEKLLSKERERHAG